jgi:two-component system response regulator GlrR
VIILTAHGSIPDAVAAVKQGVFGYLTKPFDAKALLSECERAIAVSGGSAQSLDQAGDEEWRKEIITRNPAMEDCAREGAPRGGQRRERLHLRRVRAPARS